MISINLERDTVNLFKGKFVFFGYINLWTDWCQYSYSCNEDDSPKAINYKLSKNSLQMEEHFEPDIKIGPWFLQT